MIKALTEQLGIVSVAAKQAGIDRCTHYEWMGKNPRYKEAVNKMGGLVDDIIERSFIGLVISKNPASVIHGVKTRLRHRGYVEKQEVEHTGQSFKLIIENPD